MKRVGPDLHRHYAALRQWLAAVTGVRRGLPERQLAAQRSWLAWALQQPDQPWLERLPVAIEASASLRTSGVATARFIVGTSLAPLSADPRWLLDRLMAHLHVPEPARTCWSQQLRAGQVPAAVQVGLAQTAQGWTRRLYWERGTLPVHMQAIEWRARRVSERTYAPHDAGDLTPLGRLSSSVVAAWQPFVATQSGEPALLRRDCQGQTVALHLPQQRVAVRSRWAELIALARALQLPLGETQAWLERLPDGTDLTVIALGRDGRLHANVYVAPSADAMPQPGPPPDDLRRQPGTFLLPVPTGGWLLFALPGRHLPLRPAASSPAVQVWVASALGDRPGLAAAVAAQVAPVGTLGERVAAAQAAILHLTAL